jgi:hypothetical protein
MKRNTRNRPQVPLKESILGTLVNAAALLETSFWLDVAGAQHRESVRFAHSRVFSK